jgi:hypothetical protein
MRIKGIGSAVVRQPDNSQSRRSKSAASSASAMSWREASAGQATKSVSMPNSLIPKTTRISGLSGSTVIWVICLLCKMRSPVGSRSRSIWSWSALRPRVRPITQMRWNTFSAVAPNGRGPRVTAMRRRLAYSSAHWRLLRSPSTHGAGWRAYSRLG